MKTLADGKEVSSRSYYFLLDWNEKNEWEYIHNNFNVNKLSYLTIEQYAQLFLYATQSDLKLLQ